jgi:hypothetical protein
MLAWSDRRPVGRYGNHISGVLYRDKGLSWGQTKTEYAVGQPQKSCKIGAPVLRNDTDFKIRNLGTLVFGDAKRGQIYFSDIGNG